jgi:hypothetical protein
VARVSTTKVDDTTTKVFGLSGAANFLGCDGRTVSTHADAGRLPCTRDSSGKRLFTLADLQKFKRTTRIGNQRRLPANDARNTRWPA